MLLKLKSFGESRKPVIMKAALKVLVRTLLDDYSPLMDYLRKQFLVLDRERTGLISEEVVESTMK